MIKTKPVNLFTVNFSLYIKYATNITKIELPALTIGKKYDTSYFFNKMTDAWDAIKLKNTDINIITNNLNGNLP